VERNREYAQWLSIDYPLLSDPTRKVAEAYGVASPGIARWTFYIGSDGKILYIDKNVMPTTHGKAIVAKLAELGIPKRRGR
jgi:peroxiredoxin Q/BCP